LHPTKPYSTRNLLISFHVPIVVEVEVVAVAAVVAAAAAAAAVVEVVEFKIAVYVIFRVESYMRSQLIRQSNVECPSLFS
jgi:hypothetical protein